MGNNMQRCQASDCFWIFLWLAEKPYRLAFLLAFLSLLRKPNTVQLFDSQFRINPPQLSKVESHLGCRRSTGSGRYPVVISLIHPPDEKLIHCRLEAGLSGFNIRTAFVLQKLNRCWANVGCTEWSNGFNTNQRFQEQRNVKWKV